MLYKKKNSTELDEELFLNPTAEYRATPFWAWNCLIDETMASDQIEAFKKMGFGGFHMHSRVGMAMEYLGKPFMDIVKFSVDKAKKEGMLAYLYDEDKWPSGYAGGYVTREERFRQRRLEVRTEREEHFSFDEAVNEGKNYLLAVYDIVLNDDGELLSYDMIGEDDEPRGTKWFAYIKTSQNSPWFNNQAYVDTLNKEAIDKFIDITYNAYKDAVGEEFGKTVPSIFTDEPEFARKKPLGFAKSRDFAVFPWTMKLCELYEKKYHSDMAKTIPELIWNLEGGRVSVARYRYHDFVSELFTECFADNCGKWCDEHSLLFTGHMMGEQTLEMQTDFLGETMRSYRAFSLPGIDLLCNWLEYNTAKQCQSAVHQYGREGMTCELYGVTNWDFDFRGHKFQGDWLAALGVTLRVPHLSWASMAGESKRDYPASISYQSPWYEKYGYVEDHFARLNTVLTRGKPVVDVAVIHPVESYWINYGPVQNTREKRDELDEKFSNITKWLLFGSIDFDFISESLLPSQFKGADKGLKVGCMSYKAVIVPDMETIRSTTVEILKKFHDDGGCVIFAGNCPEYVDAKENTDIKALYDECTHVPYTKTAILGSLKAYRRVEISNADGSKANDLLYNMHADGNDTWLFIARGFLPDADNAMHAGVAKESEAPRHIAVRLAGEFIPKLYDTVKGEIRDIPARYENGETVIDYDLYYSDSLLLKLTPGKKESAPVIKEAKVPDKVIRFNDKVEYERSEPNVLILDRAAFSLDGGAKHGEEDILKLDNICRRMLSWPYRGAGAQPWTLEPEKIGHYITLDFTVRSEIDYEGALLAIEDLEKLKISFNGEDVPVRQVGYFADKAIKTVRLPKIKKGENTLTVKVPFGKSTNTEYCYILGEFNVKVEGVITTIVPKTDKIGFSPLKEQGMPFYGANITYIAEIETEECTLVIDANYYRGALICVSVDGADAGNIVYSPYNLEISGVSKGRHRVEFTLYGTRINTFGGLHNIMQPKWVDLGFWRSEGDNWCYEYVLKDTGILRSPIIKVYNK